MLLLLAIAAKPTKARVEDRQQEAKRQPPVSATLKDIARVPKGGAGVSRAALPQPLARPEPAERAV